MTTSSASWTCCWADRARRIALLLVCLGPALLPAAAQVDPARADTARADTVAAPPATPEPVVRVPVRPAWVDRHSPRGALWRAAALPGWGQAYNHQYYKMPVVYLGLAAIVANIVYQNDRYLLYRHAYQWRAYENLVEAGTLPANPKAAYEADYRRLERRYGAVQASALRSVRDNFRRNRDLSYLGVGLFYGLTILDAYVNAHLLDFDIDERLSLRVLPGAGSPAAALRVRL